MTRAKGEFELQAWNEETIEELDGGGKLTRAVVEQKFTGDISGEGAVQWLMAYRPDGTATFVGMQRVKGSLGDRKGSFVLQTIGEFDGTNATGKWTVVEGSATGELEGLKGKGKFKAPHGPKADIELNYELP